LQLDGYIRVSRVGGREGESFISPAEQRDRIAAWARSRDVAIDQWHSDLDETGGKLERPGLDAALDRVRNGQSGGIVVARLDRFSRAGVADALNVIDEIHEAGGQLAALDLGIDPTTPFGEFAMTIMLGLARMERRRIGEAWQVAKRRAVERGVHFQAPFGYLKGDDGRLSPGPHAHLVRELFQRRARGDSWSQLERWMNSTGVEPLRARRWAYGTLTAMLANRAYLGEAHNAGHVLEGAHQAIVDPPLFNAVQTGRAVAAARGDGALLTGLIRCAGCRHRMTINYGAEGAPRRAYRCRRQHGEGECPEPAVVRAHLIEPHVVERFLAHYGDVGARGAEATEELQAAATAAETAELELEAFVSDTRLREALGHDRYVSAVEVRARQAEEARAALDAARGRAGAVQVMHLSKSWDTLTTEQRRRLLAAGIDAVFLRRTGNPRAPIADRTRILWRGEANDDLPGRNIRTLELRPYKW
jgi:site-specific DNA recombinase